MKKIMMYICIIATFFLATNAYAADTVYSLNKYKEEKANRKETMKKEKMANAIRKSVVAVVAVALIGWVGYSAYNAYDSYQPKVLLHY